MKKSLTKILFLNALFVAVFSTFAFAADLNGEGNVEIGSGVIQNTSSAFFRKDPSLSSPKVYGIAEGTVIPVLDTSYEGSTLFYKVLYNGEVGYVRGSFVGFTPHNFLISYFGIDGEPFDCEVGGTKLLTCQICDYSVVVDVSPSEHDKCSELGMSTDCEEDRNQRIYCSICDWEDVEIIPAPGHDFVVTEAPFPGQQSICEYGGQRITRCLRDGCTYYRMEKIPAGHTCEEVARVEPTFQSSGTATMQCSRCGFREYITIPALVDDGMTDDFFFAGSNLLDWRLEIVRDLRPRFRLHFWRTAARCCIR